MRASVTVSIAAETTGTSSAIVRVSRVAVETSFGRTADSAGTSRTSSKVSPSLANFAGRLVSAGARPSFSTSIWERYRGRRMRGAGATSGLDGLQLGELDARLQPARLSRVEAAGADLERRRGACGDGGAQRLLPRPAGVACGDERGEQDVAGADGRYRVDTRRDRAKADGLAVVAEQRDASLLGRDQDVARSHLRDAVERDAVILVVVELLPDERLGLRLVRRHEERLRLDPERERLAFGIERDLDVAPGQLARDLAVEIGLDVARQRPGEDDELRALRQIAQ